MYEICEVDGLTHKDMIDAFNAMVPETFPPLELRHYTSGHWWLAYLGDDPVGFAGMVPHVPFDVLGAWYLKRCYLKPSARGHNLQYRFMAVRIAKARALKLKMLVSECMETNTFSAHNFARSGFEKRDFVEQPWGSAGSVYWVKVL